MVPPMKQDHTMLVCLMKMDNNAKKADKQTYRPFSPREFV